MDLQYSGYDHTVHSPREQNLPHSATESSREEARALYYGMKTDQFSPDSDTLQLSSHLQPSGEEHAKQLPIRKRKISDQQYQSAFTLNTNKEGTSHSFSAVITKAEEQTERLRILLEGTASLPRLTSTKREHRADQPQSPLSSHPPQQVRATEIKQILEQILEQSLETQIIEPEITGQSSSETRETLIVQDDPAADSPLEQPDADTAEISSGSTDSASRNLLSQYDQHTTSSSASSSSIEAVYEIQEYPVETEKDQGPRAADQNSITQTITHSLESKVGELEISEADKEDGGATSIDEPAINDKPQKAGTQPDKASMLPWLSDSATETGSLADAKLSPKNADDIQQISESMQKEKPFYKKLTIRVSSVANPRLKPAKKPPKRLDTNQSASSQGTVISTARKKSVRWAASVEPNRPSSIHTETQKPHAEPLRTGPESTPVPAASFIGAKKAAIVGTPSELSDGPRTRSIKITYEYRRRYYEVYKQTFSPDTTLEVIQQRMNAEISKFKSSEYKSQYPIRAEISSVIKDLPDSKRTFSVDVPVSMKVELQDSAATPTYEQKTASLLDQLKNAEAESDSDSSFTRQK